MEEIEKLTCYEAKKKRGRIKVRHTAHNAIPKGQLGLNSILRRYAKVSAGDFVFVSRFNGNGDGKTKFIWVKKKGFD